MSFPVIPIVTLVPQQSVLWNPVTVPNTTQPVQMMFLNDGSCLMVVSNAAPSTDYLVNILAVPDQAGRTGTVTTPTGYSTTVLRGTIQYFGPFRQSWWNQTTGDVGYVYVTFGVLSGPDIGNLSAQIINF